MEQKALVATQVVKTYDKKVVLDHIDLTLEAGKIYGLIGRNGAGKTTLLSILTGQNTKDSGQVLYGGQPVWENETALQELCFSRELSPIGLFGQNQIRVRELLRTASFYYPHWDQAMAQSLLEEFEVDNKKRVYKLSKGMMSMVTIVIALASGAPITLLDEPVAGLDIVMRERFYQLLLEEYLRTNRTFVISTHIIEEAANLMEEIIFLDQGRLLAFENTEEFTDQYRYLRGREDLVQAAAQGLFVLHEEQVGRFQTFCVKVSLQQAAALEQEYPEVEIDRVPLQKLFVYLTENGRSERR